MSYSDHILCVICLSLCLSVSVFLPVHLFVCLSLYKFFTFFLDLLGQFRPNCAKRTLRQSEYKNVKVKKPHIFKEGGGVDLELLIFFFFLEILEILLFKNQRTGKAKTCVEAFLCSVNSKLKNVWPSGIVGDQNCGERGGGGERAKYYTEVYKLNILKSYPQKLNS